MRSIDVLDVDAAGLMLYDPRGRLQVLAASSEEARFMELFQLQNDEGPCLDAHREGTVVIVPDLADAAERWPRFTPAAHRAGFTAVHAVPMRCRDQALGALNLFQRDRGRLDQATAGIAQALADVATIGLLQQRAVQERELVIEQLQMALTSRVIIEQAKGVLAERTGLTMDQAFERLRSHARRTSRKLTDLAQAIVTGGDDLPRRLR